MQKCILAWRVPRVKRRSLGVWSGDLHAWIVGFVSECSWKWLECNPERWVLADRLSRAAGLCAYLACRSISGD
jgi:hypothetical protein